MAGNQKADFEICQLAVAVRVRKDQSSAWPGEAFPDTGHQIPGDQDKKARRQKESGRRGLPGGCDQKSL